MKVNGVGIGRVQRFPLVKTPLRRRIRCICNHRNNCSDNANTEDDETHVM